MKKILLYCLLLLMVISYAALAVEIRNRGEIVTADEMTADSLLNLADDVFQQRRYDEALVEYTKVYEAAQKEFNRSVEIEALSQMARMNLILGHKEEGLKYLQQAAERVSDSDPMAWSRYLGVKGRFEWKDDDLPASRKTFETMLDYCNANSLWGRAVDAAHMLAIVAETPEEQIKWSRKGIEAAEASDNESWLGPLWNNLAATYYDMKQYDSALTCYQTSREYHWRFSGETAKLFADYHIGMTYRLLGQYEEAQKWLRPVLAWAERLGNNSAIGQACEDLGECQIALGNKAEGLKYLKQAREEYKKVGFNESWPEIWDNINQRISENE